MIRKLLALIAVLFFSKNAIAESNVVNFEIDPKLQTIAAVYAEDCVNWVSENFNASIGYEDRNIIAIENFLEDLHKYVQKNPMPEQRKETFTKMFGFYIGEVYRRNHGGVSWGWVTIDGQKYHALGNKTSGKALFWPIAKVQKRIQLGSEENVLHYYQALVANKI